MPNNSTHTWSTTRCLQDTRSDVAERGQEVTEVCTKGHEVLALCQKPDQMSDKLKELTDSWQELSDAARDRHIILQQHLQVCMTLL